MKPILLAATLVALPAVLAAQTDGSESIFRQSFEGMFDAPSGPLPLPHRVMEPNPPVPLDGGILLLLAGGVAVARKRLVR